MFTSSSKFISLLAAGTIILVSPCAVAAAAPHSKSDISKTTCTASVKPAKSKDTTTLPDKAEILNTVKDGIASGTVSVNGGVDKLDFNRTKISTVENKKGESFDFVTVPYRNDNGYNYLSNVTVGYKVGDHSSPVTQSETLYTQSVDNKFRVKVFQDGQVIKNEKLDIDYVDGATLQANQNFDVPNPDTAELQGWGAKTACIGAILGVNSVVAALITSTCVGACTAEPVGAAVCAACIGGIATIGGADIMSIIECFKL